MDDLGTNRTLLRLSMPLPNTTRVGAARAPEWIWVSRKRSALVETRLIIAYSLIGVMAALVVFGGILWSKKREKSRQRGSGRGRDY